MTSDTIGELRTITIALIDKTHQLELHFENSSQAGSGDEAATMRAYRATLRTLLTSLRSLAIQERR